MLRYVIAEQKQPWDAILRQLEFAYNSTINKLTGQNPFSIVYAKKSNHSIDLTVLPKPTNPKAENMATYYSKLIHEVRATLEQANLH